MKFKHLQLVLQSNKNESTEYYKNIRRQNVNY